MTLIVDHIDHDRGVIRLRRATRWERFVHAVRRPIQWMRSKFGPRVRTVVAPSVTLADPADVWNFREGERVVIPDPWRDQK